MKIKIHLLLFIILNSLFAYGQDKRQAIRQHEQSYLQQQSGATHDVVLKFGRMHGEKKFYASGLHRIISNNAAQSPNPQIIMLIPDKTDTMIAAEYKKNNLHGKWTSWYKQGFPADSGSMSKGIPDGEWRVYYANGSLRYIRHFDAFLLRKIKNDIIRENRYSSYSIAAMFKKNPASAEGYLQAGYFFSGQVNAATNNLSLMERVNHNVTIVESGNYYPPFREGLLHGVYINYYPNGAIQDSGYYKYGLRDGLWQEWENEGRIKKIGVYHKGIKKGMWKYYNNQGKLTALKQLNKAGEEVYFKRF